MWKDREAGDDRPPRTRSGAQSPGDGETDSVGPGPWECEASGRLCRLGQRAVPPTPPAWRHRSGQGLDCAGRQRGGGGAGMARGAGGAGGGVTRGAGTTRPPTAKPAACSSGGGPALPAPSPRGRLGLPRPAFSPPSAPRPALRWAPEIRGSGPSVWARPALGAWDPAGRGGGCPGGSVTGAAEPGQDHPRGGPAPGCAFGRGSWGLWGWAGCSGGAEGQAGWRNAEEA